MGPALELHQVSVVRAGATLLDRIDWQIHDGEHWVVLGPNGAGKTTLLQVVGGYLHPTAGEAWVLGERVGETDLAVLRPRIGHTGTTVSERIPPAETVGDVVLSAAHAVIGRWNEEYEQTDFDRAAQIMAELGIAPLAERTFGTLSEGERKRTLIARSLMTDPEMLLLDEPAAGLDLGAREDLVSSLEVLGTAADAPVLILVSHHVEEIPPSFTHVLMLREGKVVAQGPIPTTLTPANLGHTFSTRLEIGFEHGRFTARRVHYGWRRLT
jgi:iron complex transport system ATP-binding protein